MPKRKTPSETLPKELTVTEPDTDSDRRDDDSLWKDIIERFFYPMLARAIPDLYAAAETQTPPRFLDKELKKATYQLKGGKHSVDLLAEVPLKDGANEWVLFHMEVQGRGGESLPFRMAHYRALIFSMFGREPVALVLITDRRPKGESEFYESGLYGTSTVYRYNRLVVSELDEEGLLVSDNPFDLALCAAQRALKSKRDERRKHAYMKELLGFLGDRGWNHEDKHRLLLFIENIIVLEDRELKLDIVEYEEELEKEGKIVHQPLIVEMKYGPIWEEKGREQGKLEGRLEGKLEGRIEGKLEGKLEGRLEGKLETARNLLKMGLTVEQIVKATELPEEDVRKLLN